MHQYISSFYQIDKERGFLPTNNPTTCLSGHFTLWDEMAQQFSGLINAGALRCALENMPIIDAENLANHELERAMLLLSCFGSAFVFGDKITANYIPPAVAIPWLQVAQRLGRKPVLAHASLVLQNWQIIKPDKPITTNNICTLMQFHGGLDEAFFYLLTVEIEAVGAKAVWAIVDVLDEINNNDRLAVYEAMKRCNASLKDMHKSLKKMYWHCDPYIFYKRVRPFLGSFQQVNFKGTKTNKTKSYHGGSAAQSSLMQLFDAAFNLSHEKNAKAYSFLQEMQSYMPPKHAAFVQYVKKISTIKTWCEQDVIAQNLYNETIDLLLDFRNEHLKIAAEYIIKPSKNEKALGTGGTDAMRFLKQIRNNTGMKK